MMEPMMVLIMGFFLTAIVLTGGFVLMMPLSKQLARYLEFRMQDKAGNNPVVQNELRQLRAAVEGLEEKLHSVSDRQEFVEKMLESRDTNQPKLPR